MKKETETTSPVIMAAKAQMVARLHIDFACDAGFDVPLKDILQADEDGQPTKALSLDTLHHLSLTALFKNSPGGKIPDYAQKHFDTRFTFQLPNQQKKEQNGIKGIKESKESKGGKKALGVAMDNSPDSILAFEKICAEHMMDDNDDIILHVNCTFINTFAEENVKKIRAGATAAADNVVTTMKTWVRKVSTIVQKISNERKEEREYVDVVLPEKKNTIKSEETKPNPVEWASRFVHFLSTPEDLKECPHRKAPFFAAPASASASAPAPASTDASKSKNHIRAEQVFDHLSDMITESIFRVSDVISEITKHHDEMIRDLYTTPKTTKFVQNNSSNSNSNNNNSNEHDNISCSNSEMSKASLVSMCCSDNDSNISFMTEEEKGVEIVFDSADKSAPEEWKVFFGGDDDDEDDVSDGEVMIEIPNVQDIISVSSDESPDIISISSEEQEVKDDNDDDDDDSWAMLDDDE